MTLYIRGGLSFLRMTTTVRIKVDAVFSVRRRKIASRIMVRHGSVRGRSKEREEATKIEFIRVLADQKQPAQISGNL